MQRLACNNTIANRGRSRVVRTPDFEEIILLLDVLVENPNISRQLSAMFNADHMTVWRVIHEQLLYLHHMAVLSIGNLRKGTVICWHIARVRHTICIRGPALPFAIIFLDGLFSKLLIRCLSLFMLLIISVIY